MAWQAAPRGRPCAWRGWPRLSVALRPPAAVRPSYGLDADACPQPVVTVRDGTESPLSEDNR